ncbi:flagellar basal body rod C-terminal domain-containing protein [Cellulomonas sp. ATA003]|uniref:flagellar basal body rod C-terminal domain-containing protein n=1 Tax=Cellulomonas sp. ATA003 TaxID=3073064 RepID=UPI002873EAA2|nr:flagellar basal body rod C-terminal domain-containing protein [Cellulomonas sp. ATA003]WNB85254.1 flagellar basal body rod C-terminal domain-containing protein [Cellulomonas sp. ATA003]
MAKSLVTAVNAIHGGAVTPGGAPGGDFFVPVPTDGTSWSAASLAVAVRDTSAIAVADPARGPRDGSVADALAQLGTAAKSPNAEWSSFVVDLGVDSRSATQRATVAEATRSTAERIQLAGASVDIDEESVNMLAYQRAYEGAARVLTAIDEMLDTLINRTGVVGR